MTPPILALLVSIGCAPAPVDSGASPPPAPGPYLYDPSGRVVLHRGMNVAQSAKAAEDHLPETTEASWAYLRDSGFSLVRLLVFWEAVMPEEGVLDEAYLARLDDLLAFLDGLGPAVLLDMHQDLWGEGFGAAGAPRWACDEAHYATYDPPGNYWWEGYLTEEVRACFDAFWADEGLQDGYAEAWAAVAAVARDHPAVVGYDLMNEPFFGSLDQATFEGEVLPAFYARVTDAIRAVDAAECPWGGARAPCRFVALEPSLHANVTGESILEFPERAGLVFAPHFYTAYSETGSGWNGTFDAEAEVLAAHVRHGQGAGLPVIFGEYGIFSAEGNEHGWVRAVQDAVEPLLAGTAYWTWDPGTTSVISGDGEPGYMMPAFQRPYLHRIPGEAIAVTAVDDGMEATWTPTSSAPAVAVVPAACSGTRVDGATVTGKEGPFWTLDPGEPGQDGTVTVTVSGCLPARPPGSPESGEVP